MSANINVDIAIVGGGIVGSSFAALIAQQAKSRSLRIALIDASPLACEPDTSTFDPRVVALSAASREILSRAGAWSLIEARRVCAYSKMHVWDGEGTGSIGFSAADIHEDQLGHICENQMVVAGLNEVLESLPNIMQIRDCSVQDMQLNNDGRMLTLDDGTTVQAGLVVAADGALSKMRTLGEIGTTEWAYNHTAIVTTVRTEKSHQFSAWQRFSVDGPLAFLPLSADGIDGTQSSIVWSLETSRADAMMALTDSEFKIALTQALECKLGEVIEIDKRVAIPLKQRFAKHYSVQSLVLIGDAAHTIHPLAGQGVNLGLYDVASLACEIERACERGIAINEHATLRRYERARKPHNLIAMSMMEAFKRGFGSDEPLIRYLRNSGLTLVNKNFMLKKVFSKLAAGNV